MPLSTWLSGTRALLGFARNAGRASEPAQKREHLQVSSPETGEAPGPLLLALFNVEQEIRSVLDDAAAEVRPQPVRFEIAVQPELALRAYRSVFHQALAGLVQQACSQALVSRVLVTASRSREWVQVNVTDDGLGASRRAREDAAQPIERLIARQGATLDIKSWPDQGTTVLTRWPMTGPVEAGHGRVPLLARERTFID